MSDKQAAPVDDPTVDPLSVEPIDEQANKDQKPLESAPDDKSGFVETDNEKVQARINKITAEKYAEKRRADDLQAQLNTHQPQVTTNEPKLEDFDYDEAQFQSALIDFKVNKKAVELQQQQTDQLQQQQRTHLQSSFNAKMAEQMATTPDYQAAVSLLPEFPADTLDAIMQADNGPQLAYYLGKHMDVADEIASATPMVAAMKLGQISAQLNGSKPNVQPSAAPEPIDPVNSSGTLNKDLEEMSMEEIYNS